MANLVAPINRLQPIEERTIEFKGLNRRSYVEDGEMSAMTNLTADDYPLLSPRKLRGTYRQIPSVLRPLQIIARYDRMAMIAEEENSDISFYYNGIKIDAVNNLTEDSTMVAINTKICFLPQKTYLEIVNHGRDYTIGNYGSLEAATDLSSTAVTISNEDVRITLPDSNPYRYDDALNIEGTLTYTPSGGTSTTKACNVSCIIEQVVNGNTLVLPRETFIELTGEGATNITFDGFIKRTMPDMDYVMEWNNRLWGCNTEENIIYACKLGDPTNWHYYQGTALDSYYAQQGTDGKWTGMGVYSSHIIFFKSDSMTKVYGTSPSTFQVVNTKCYGVESGSEKSVVTINDVVYYKSAIGIMAYEGGTPVCISEKLGTNFANVVAGTEGSKYYASCQNKKSGYEMLVYDVSKGVWHREDNTRMRDCCTIQNRLYFITYNNTELLCSLITYCSATLTCGGAETASGAVTIVNPAIERERYADLTWSATFGPFDEYIEEHKIYSKLALRLKANGPSTVKVYISMDEGEWELVKEFSSAQTNGEVIPIVPRRCDRYSVKIDGKGNCEIASLTRRVRMGSFGKL